MAPSNDFPPLDLVFRRVQRRDKPGQKQWQACRKGNTATVVYTPDDTSPDPEAENERWRCEEGRTIFNGNDLQIVSVHLQEKLLTYGEVVKLCFELVERGNGKGKSWQARRNENGVTTIFVPDKRGPQPTSSDTFWEGTVSFLVYRSDNGLLRIVAVQLAKELISERGKRRRDRKKAAKV
ncbi:MAG: hypothetical protein A3C80_00115 [Candidatus Ryanbacteria bacterium RIFCSPHIGHO2_02_FULL_45_43]|uniref:Uncharacterized protein n=1 Tax=Candidatus Ryanbacteria bacterium RIFCSPHIGHO2_01_45_13 TaxID=1802112 RepID=A0A1G2G080_9BACT|nr:MAG: hypothetical protein A2718_01500 [Candidatus Ryanbacteria bacterium RIFCSPHIGHO2_01_FULL_44_130]OGZ43745.1 MAG: hypothetical protein A2W41_04615 [Candidatus Ryanbacteria bacterium RIFCSPHIGHO2_01_45_13]OGZ47688.1 MAG: hypothetical protein A3C80_00115 [Candidatus Ryanbacteria bacterium RIFCSPHIGHO2_02_FULL_45_43]OGZ49584.1 MAG: hypothetical protein A3E55_04115 [Candidatus Ryanbacteria bacterium RIFCSPHIGHO2_12_FULL_44_20]OGZ51266.1 MAG: hypothetical protein A3A17_04440 [Candidatus Ryanba